MGQRRANCDNVPGQQNVRQHESKSARGEHRLWPEGERRHRGQYKEVDHRRKQKPPRIAAEHKIQSDKNCRQYNPKHNLPAYRFLFMEKYGTQQDMACGEKGNARQKAHIDGNVGSETEKLCETKADIQPVRIAEGAEQTQQSGKKGGQPFSKGEQKPAFRQKIDDRFFCHKQNGHCRQQYYRRFGFDIHMLSLLPQKRGVIVNFDNVIVILRNAVVKKISLYRRKKASPTEILLSEMLLHYIKISVCFQPVRGSIQGLG